MRTLCPAYAPFTRLKLFKCGHGPHCFCVIDLTPSSPGGESYAKSAPRGTFVLTHTHIIYSKAKKGSEWCYLLQKHDAPLDETVTHKVFFDIAVGEEKVGRIVFGLYGKVLVCTKSVCVCV